MAQKKNNSSKKSKQKNTLRIIGGCWRSRRIQFFDSPDVRPTPDRVRETLFNWLSSKITSARCLDLFAGSGALGFEAASRGASSVTLIDFDEKIIATLNEQKKILAAEQVNIVQQDALTFLQTTQQVFDIIFLDPPFASELYQPVLTTILSNKLIVTKGLIYIECSFSQDKNITTQGLNCLHKKQAGEVQYALYEYQAVNE